MIVPLRYMGEGEFQAPKGFAAQCDAALVVGEMLRWQTAHERSAASHAHYFAVIADAWANLPENLVDEFPSPEHLRKYALIKAGFCNVRKIVDDGRPHTLHMDTYAIVEIANGVTTIYTAQSQSVKAMGKAEFQKSKDAVLSEIGKLIGADPAELGKAA